MSNIQATTSQSSMNRVRLTTHSTSISNIVLLGYHKLSDGAKLTYMVLESYDWPDENGLSKGRCWPSIETIAEARGKSYDTILRHLKELETIGLIRIESGQERGKPNCYWLLEPSASEAELYISHYAKTGTRDKDMVNSEQDCNKTNNAQVGVLQNQDSHPRKVATPTPSDLRHKEEFNQESNGNKLEVIDSNQANTYSKNVDKPIKPNRHISYIPSNRYPHTHSGKSDKSQANLSNYLAKVMDDFSRALNDQEHAPSNRTQVGKIWKQSGLDETVFIELLYEAKKRTQWAALAKGSSGDTPPNRAAYFFQVVRSLVNQHITHPYPTFRANQSQPQSAQWRAV